VNVAVDIACLQADLGPHGWVVSAGGAYEGLLEDHGVAPVRLEQGPACRVFLSPCSACAGSWPRSGPR
jgi:hypothetical protein